MASCASAFALLGPIVERIAVLARPHGIALHSCFLAFDLRATTLGSSALVEALTKGWLEVHVVDIFQARLEFAIGPTVLALPLWHAHLVFQAEPRLVAVIAGIVDRPRASIDHHLHVWVRVATARGRGSLLLDDLVGLKNRLCQLLDEPLREVIELSDDDQLLFR